MEKALKELEKLLENPLKDIEIIVDEITFYEKDKNKFLTVVLDKVGGIDMDTIVEASHIVNKVVDDMNFPSENYILDVISKERG